MTKNVLFDSFACSRYYSFKWLYASHKTLIQVIFHQSHEEKSGGLGMIMLLPTLLDHMFQSTKSALFVPKGTKDTDNVMRSSILQ